MPDLDERIDEEVRDFRLTYEVIYG